MWSGPEIPKWARNLKVGQNPQFPTTHKRPLDAFEMANDPPWSALIFYTKRECYFVMRIHNVKGLEPRFLIGWFL